MKTTNSLNAWPAYSSLLLIMLIILTACGDNGNNRTLSRIKKEGKLIILTTNRPTTYHYDRDNLLAGPEYEMSQDFARDLGVQVEYKVYNSTKDVIEALRHQEGDIAAAGLTKTSSRQTEFDFGPTYQKTEEYLVCHRSRRQIKTKKELQGIEVTVAPNTSFIKTLEQYPELSLHISDNADTTQLLAQVAAKEINCTVSDSTLYSIERRYHTSLQNKYSLAQETELAWMLNKTSTDLKDAVNTWFATYRDEGYLAEMINKYYGFVEIFDYVDIHKFLRRIKTRLPPYKDFFIDAAQKNNISPSVLAAQSYQESHWNRKAKSPTGVRGLMMLTQPVAKSLGVTNRLHARQNIYAGAKFHAKMKKMIPSVKEPDRTWLALAAYNIGRGHFRDAQALARKLKKDPDKWYEMKEVLPLLSKKEYYQNLQYGYARGNEPVRYVMRIRNYEDRLHSLFNSQKKD
jgi:membrane-bound lytic murein transglycosylase F